MVEKRYNEMIDCSIPERKLTFKHVGRGLKASFDRGLLQKHLPPTSGVLTGDASLVTNLSEYLPENVVEALSATNFVNVYGRVIEYEGRSKLKCLQYLYVWDYQAVPEHEADYEPIYVFLDGDEKYAIYDLVHYCSRKISLSGVNTEDNGLQMIPGWHSFIPTSNLPKEKRDQGLEVVPLSDQHLEKWWSIPEEEPRLKIDGFLRDPFALKAPGHFLDNPDEEAKTFCCTFKEIEYALQEFENPREGIIEGIKRAFTKCVGIFALYRLGAFVKLLIEMNDVGMVQAPASLRAGLNLASISEFLKEGFISLTNAGANLFNSMKNSQSDDKE